MKITKKCNCKINLSLKIVGLKDGYHLLESIFCPINIYDEIEVELSSEDCVVGMDIPQEKNIIYKTIKKIKEIYGIKKSVKVSIKKNIPLQAGLGGGSSNAAFTILALNELFDLQLDTEEMINIGKEIGSDVPFFIINKPSFVEGRGEKIKPLENFKKIYGILVFDDVFMSTKDVFEKYDQINDIDEKSENDLESAVFLLNGGEKVKKCKKTLLECGCEKALMSGAGGSVFGLCGKEDVDKIFKKIKDKYEKVWIFESI